jgi:soluble lytic murein transglycosylase-like protein
MLSLRRILPVMVSVALPSLARAPAVVPAPPPLPLPLQALAAPPPLVLDRPVAQAILAFIRRVNPDVPAARAADLTRTIVEASERHRLDPLLLAGIMAQESHFHADVQSCIGRGCDLGVAQVNWETWGAELKLERARLIHDDAYNVGVAADILADIRLRFGEEGGRWWTRYHDRRPERRTEYGQLVRAHAPVLLGSL